jgi:hypothetical protein
MNPVCKSIETLQEGSNGGPAGPPVYPRTETPVKDSTARPRTG